MTTWLQPCGTNAAWQRHYVHKETVDDACLEAHRKHMREYMRAYRAAKPPPGPPRGRRW